MSLRPLANLLAVWDPDPERLAAIETRLERSNEFELWHPAPGWVVGITPLPGSDWDARPSLAAGLVFAEGIDRVMPRATQGRSPGAVAELANRFPERLATLPGDFGFLCFDGDGALTAVRSCGGLVPLYHTAPHAESVALATRLDYFVRFMPDPPRLDAFGLGAWLSGFFFFPDKRTLLEGVSILGRGQYLRLQPGRKSEIGTYWDPRPEKGDQLTATPEHRFRLREILLDALERDLDPAGGNLLTLSGGVDSSSLGALAVGKLGRSTAALSLLPLHPGARARDVHYIEGLARHFRFEPSWRVVLSMGKRIALLGEVRDVCLPVAHPALCLLGKIQEEWPVRVLFGGEFADETQGSLALLSDWASHTSLLTLIFGGLGNLPSGPRDLLRWPKRRLLTTIGRPLMPFPGPELPPLVRREVREEYREWAVRRRRAAARDDRPLRYLALMGEADAFVPMNWEAASSLGVRRSFPFFNRDVLELAFSCHPSELVGPGPKKLLRAALDGDVPAANLYRPDKGHVPPEHDPIPPWQTPLPPGLDSIVRDDWYPLPPADIDDMNTLLLTLLVETVSRISVARASIPS